MKKLYLGMLFGLLMQLLSAQIPPSPPAGWSSQAISGAILFTSPADEQGARLTLAVLPATRAKGELKDWYDMWTRGLLQSMDLQPQQIGDVSQENGTLMRKVTLEKQHMVMLGYPTPGGWSLSILIVPSSLDHQDPRLAAAVAYAGQLVEQKFEVNNGNPPAAIQPGQHVGQFGRSDIDLTYHAKAIPPRERDVPLKGSYLFVGSEFGASYGGVGTTMTWGRKSTALLLLLFANGVAARFDARGGNLAGKYQAEGFASLDVANQAVVSGTPFGQWTDDGNSIRIHWNNGEGADLVKNGRNLDGARQHWTPFILSDGVTLEGTFVRKLEAGLRSEVLVLHKDGTFAGDGLNVTMGGSAVNPAFPARGSGRYEVRKGSMILYFANGFTQSIACTLNPPNSAEASVVLLNEFPFERVR